MEVDEVQDEAYNDMQEKCDCGRVVAFIRDNKVYVKCRHCKRWIAIIDIAGAQATVRGHQE